MKVIRLILFQGQVLHILIANSAMKFTQSVAIAANARSGVTLLLYKTIGHHDVKIEPFEKWLKTEDSSSRGLSPLSSSRLSTASLLPDTASVRVRQVTPHLSSAF
jgi:hypothetical protein